MLHAQLVDPRYASDIFDKPLYRVDFWAGDVSSEEWLIDGASMYEEVWDWALQHAGDRTIVIYVQSIASSRVLLRLHGEEPR